MTTGVVESLNVVLKDARDLPIWLIEELRFYFKSGLQTLNNKHCQ